MVDVDIWKNGAGKVVAYEGIEIRWRQNGGQWTAWQESLSPIDARWGTSQFRPFVLKVSKPEAGKHYYAFIVGQEDTDVIDYEFKHGGVTQYVTQTGCKPATRAIRENL
jgi:hypothetical protein